MTYDWPTSSTIHPARCRKTATSTGERCKRRAWITTHEAPDGYLCFQHGGTKAMRR